MKKILYVVNDLGFFLSHRLPLAVSAKDSGFEVCVASNYSELETVLDDYGFSFYGFPIQRSGKNPFREFLTFIRLLSVFRAVKPDLVHLVTIKPVLYGGIAARLTKVPSMVAAISGLGTVFVARGGRQRLLKHMVSVLYRLSLGHRNLVVIFQNPDDRAVLSNIGVIKKCQARLIRGSGVALAECPIVAEPGGPPTVTMASRLLRDKGVVEFVEAARLLAGRGVTVRFRLIGTPDPGNPTTITQDELAAWKEEGLVELPGYLNDIPVQYAQSNIVCLPSYYGEGLPKSLVEAAACGRVVVTTDMPGCRDAIEPGKSGVLVPPCDAAALADAIQRLVERPEERRSMGLAGRELAEREFSIDRIAALHLAIYQELEGKVRTLRPQQAF